MPRIRQYEQKYAEDDFRKEVRIRQGYYDLMSQNALAEAVGIPRPTLRKRLLEPGGMSVEELRKLVKTVKPAPEIILKLLGYTGKDIKALSGVSGDTQYAAQE